MQNEELMGLELYAGKGKVLFKDKRNDIKIKVHSEFKQPLRFGKAVNEGNLLKANILTIQRTPVGNLTLQRLEDGASKLEIRFQPETDFNQFWLSFPVPTRDLIYGGDAENGFVKKGKKVIVWNGKEGCCKQADFLIAGHEKRLVHLESKAYMEFDFTKPEEVTIFSLEAPTAYFFTADSYEKLQEKLCALLGRPEEIPAFFEKDWIENEKPVFEKWNQLSPFIPYKTDAFFQAREEARLVQSKKGKPVLVRKDGRKSAITELLIPEAYEKNKQAFQKDLREQRQAQGAVSAATYFAKEAAIYPATGTQDSLHNTYVERWARLNQELEEFSGELSFVLPDYFQGAAKYNAVHYAGPRPGEKLTEDFLKKLLQELLAMAVFGNPISFCGILMPERELDNKEEELFYRYCEICAFTPLFGLFTTAALENEKMEHFVTKMTKIHAILKPYLELILQGAINKGVPVMKPLFYAYPEREAFVVEDEYLLGNDFLVAPVYALGSLEREVFLPEDHWIHVWSGQEYEGGRHRIAAPIEQIPVFIRKNSLWKKVVTFLTESAIID